MISSSLQLLSLFIITAVAGQQRLSHDQLLRWALLIPLHSCVTSRKVKHDVFYQENSNKITLCQNPSRNTSNLISIRNCHIRQLMEEALERRAVAQGLTPPQQRYSRTSTSSCSNTSGTRTYPTPAEVLVY